MTSRRRESHLFGLSGCVICGMSAALIAATLGTRGETALSCAILSEGAPEALCRADAAAPPILPGFTYIGVSGCMGSGCHDDEKPTEHSGKLIGDEYNIWFDHDPHKDACETLFDDASTEIAEKLSLADPAASERCLSCHTTYPPEPQRDETFDVEQGVGCETCHGAGEKYLEPHATEGWTNEQRGKIGAAGLRTEYGLIDTTDLAARAQMCVSCHLQIDKDLLDAGHPALQFELYSYNHYIYGDEHGRIHWDDSSVPWINAKLWAIGQAASLEAAQAQSAAWKSKGWDTAAADELVAIYEAGAKIAAKHFGANTPAALAAATYSAEACKAAAADLAALAANASSQVQRKNLAFGLVALGEACFKAAGGEVPAAFRTASKAATAGQEGDDWTKAIKEMADLIGK